MESPVRVRYETIEFGDLDIHVRSLRDLCEFNDDDGVAEALGISSAVWPRFGVLWPSSRALAELMADYDVGDRRVLEVGCGLALASLVLNERDADITATDRHPEAETFLEANVALNEADEIPFVRTGWTDADSGMGEFDLIIASEVLYEREHVEALSNFIDRHAKPTCEVVIVDPGRGETGRFAKRMATLGFTHTQDAAEAPESLDKPYRGKVHTFVRAAESTDAE